MTYAVYPTLPTALGDDPKPLSKTDVTVAQNGRAYVQHRAVFDDAEIDILHPFLTSVQSLEVFQFFADIRGNKFLWTRESTGETYQAQFKHRPSKKHVGGDYWDVEVSLIVSAEAIV